EIPTAALNEVDGQSLVFVQPKDAGPAFGRGEFELRRVAVVSRFKDKCLVRSKLSRGDEKINAQEDEGEERGRRVRALQEGDRVLTRGVVAVTAALEELLVEERHLGKKE